MQSFAASDVDCSLVTEVNKNCPETWPNIPQNILDDPDLARSALVCVHDMFDDEDQHVTGDYSSLINKTVDTINYVNFMSQFYDVMAWVRIIFQIVLIIY